MDEILDRIKNNFRSFKKISFTRRQIAITLIIVEAIGILSLIWYLKDPLSRKYLTYAPKAYSVIVMNPKVSYVLRNGDFLVGNTIPNTKVTTLITPDKIKNLAVAEQDGSWSYRIPDDIIPGRYKFTVGYFDKSNKLTFYRTYNIRISSSNIIQVWSNKIAGWFPFSLKKARAQTFGPERTSFVAGNDYNLTIVNIGSQSNTINPGDNISPQALVYDYSGNWITEDNNFTINYFLQNDAGEITNLITFDDCTGTNICSWKIPDDLVPSYYYLSASLNITDQNPVISSNTIRINIGQDIPLQKIDSETSAYIDSNTTPQRYLSGTGECIARGKLFASGNNIPLGYMLDGEGLLTRQFELLEWVDPEEDFCILGKYDDGSGDRTYKYKVDFDQNLQKFTDPSVPGFANRDVFFAVPIGNISIVSGEILQPETDYPKNEKTGVRVGLLREGNAGKVFDAVDQLGVGVVRILIDEALWDENTKQLELIAEAAKRGYFIILQYQLGERPHRSPRKDNRELIKQLKADSILEAQSDLSNYEIDKAITKFRLSKFTEFLKSYNVPTYRFAFELGNEPNERWGQHIDEKGRTWGDGDKGKYFHDCADFRTDEKGETLLRDIDGRVLVIDLNPDSPTCNPRNIDRYGASYMYRISNAFADFIDSSSAAIAEIDPDIKVIVGALFLQTYQSNDNDSVDKKSQEEITLFLDALRNLVGDRIDNFDFALHGYHVWDLCTDRQARSLGESGRCNQSYRGSPAWKAANSGPGAAYDSYMDNPAFQQIRVQNKSKFWVTEFGIDQKTQGNRIYNMANALNSLEGFPLINSIIAHEFNVSSGDNDNPDSVYDLWNEDSGTKYPLYNILQYENLYDYIVAAK